MNLNYCMSTIYTCARCNCINMLKCTGSKASMCLFTQVTGLKQIFFIANCIPNPDTKYIFIYLAKTKLFLHFCPGEKMIYCIDLARLQHRIRHVNIFHMLSVVLLTTGFSCSALSGQKFYNFNIFFYYLFFYQIPPKQPYSAARSAQP